jgi:hydroxylamine reductase
MGVCGKEPETAALLDLLIYAVRGISVYAHRAGRIGLRDAEVDQFVIDALVATVTNVNFSPERIRLILEEASLVKQIAKSMYERGVKNGTLPIEAFEGAALWEPAIHIDDLIRQGEAVGIEERIRREGADAVGLSEMVVYGIKGMAAYAAQAWILGQKDAAVIAFIYKALSYLESPQLSNEELYSYLIECGQMNLRVMELLDRGHTQNFGNPAPTPVRMDPIPGKCILVSGHDLKDLQTLLRQTEGLGINVYTHGEMLPAHGYPHLRKYLHLVGNYGGAWQDQARDFDAFPGAILMTTNCIQKPKRSYMSRLFTSGSVAWPGVKHISDRDFQPVIKAALSGAGFEESAQRKTVTVGYAHEAMRGLSTQLTAGLQSGAIRRLFIIGGCDGARTGRNYYSEFVERLPQNAVILTMGCAKYRFNAMELGSISGIPRLLDCGQCNDMFSAIGLVRSLAEALNCGINELPLTLNISWYEQKLFAVLLSLWSLGIQNIRLGPTMPAFVTPFIRNMLEEKFKIQQVGIVDFDMDESFAR